MRFAPAYDSHDFADATSRDGLSAPRLRASSPTTHCAGCVVLPRQPRDCRRENRTRRRRRETTAAANGRRHLAGFDELRDRQHLDRRAASSLRQIGARDRAVGRAEIDPDAVSRASPAIGVVYGDLDFGRRDDRAAGRAERRQLRRATTRQPRCRSVPRNGGVPVTLPTRWNAAGSID